MSLSSELERCQQSCNELRQQLEVSRNVTSTKILSEVGSRVEVPNLQLRDYKLCTGHFGKIYALHWGINSIYIVTASQDGKLIIWNGLTGNKQLAITLTSSWVMTCAFSPQQTFIVSGGLDNTVSMFRVTGSDPEQTHFKEKELYCELEKHDGYLSCARFVNEQEIISASGDGTCILWDIESQQPQNTFYHQGDIMSISLNKKEPNLFCSGSVDATVRVWDFRTNENSIAIFRGHESDINAVSWFPDSQCIASGSDDGSVRLFDMRSYRQLNHFIDKNNQSLHAPEVSGVTSVDSSLTGSYIFSAYDNGHVYCWNSVTGSKISDLQHEARVSSLGISPNGFALATGCWDFNLKIFT